MLRTSSYTIHVDLPDGRDEVLLIHGYTGAYDRVSRQVARYLRAHSGNHPAGAPDGDGWQPRGETLAALERRGYLTGKTHAEEEALFGRLTGTIHQRGQRQQPGYVLMPTYSCNLRCPYCFQHHMRTDPAYSHLIRVMTPETVDRIFAAIPAIEERHGLDPAAERERGFLFFGGEPLLASSRPVVERIMRAAEAMPRPKFTAISNGTELDAYRDLLGPGKIVSLQITLDGAPAEHDGKRVYPDGSGSFAKIADNVSMALEAGARVTLRLNVDRANVGSLPELAREIDTRGWRTHKNVLVYVSPIHSAKSDGAELMDSWVLKQRLGAFQRQHPEVRRVGHIDDSLQGRLRRVFEEKANPTPSFKASFCAAHSTMYIFDAFADIYACWEHTGDKNIRVGWVDESGRPAFDDGRLAMWRDRNVVSNPICRRCRYAFYCGGGCANLAWGRTGDLNTSVCDGFANRFRSTAAKVYLDFVAGLKPAPTEEPACDR
jgi:uncharacterized protein